MDLKKVFARAAVNAGESISNDDKPIETKEDTFANTAAGLLETYLENTTKEERIETIERLVKSIISNFGPRAGKEKGYKAEDYIPEYLGKEEIAEYVKTAVQTAIDATLTDIPQEERIELIDHVFDKIMTRPARLRQPLLAEQTRKELIELAKFATVRFMNDVPARLVAEGKEIAKDVLVQVKKKVENADKNTYNKEPIDDIDKVEVTKSGEKGEGKENPSLENLENEEMDYEDADSVGLEWVKMLIRMGYEGVRALSSEVIKLLRDARTLIEKFTFENPILIKIKNLVIKALEKTEEVVEVVFGEAVVLISDVISIFAEFLEEILTDLLNLILHNRLFRFVKLLLLGEEEHYETKKVAPDDEEKKLSDTKNVREVIKGVLEKKENELVEKLDENDITVEKAKEIIGVSDEAMGYIVADLIKKDKANVKISAKKHDKKEEKQPKPEVKAETKTEKESKVEPKPETQRISKVRVMKIKEITQEDKTDTKNDRKENTESNPDNPNNPTMQQTKQIQSQSTQQDSQKEDSIDEKDKKGS